MHRCGKTLAPSYVDSLKGSEVPMPEGLPTTGLCGEISWREAGPPKHLDGAAPLEVGERSCAEAVVGYLALDCSISRANIEAMLSSDY